MKTINFTGAALLALAISTLDTGTARAGCTCICVDGLNRPLCESAAERRPLCPPRVCPRDPAITRPLDQAGRPHPRGRTCAPAKIYNRYSGRYEWWRLCD